MSVHSTVAARCAAIGSGIAQIIADTSGVARVVRNARHDINTVNSDLLSIKVCLDIARDDFSSANPSLPSLLLEAASGFLDCCSTATGRLHKAIVRVSASENCSEPWQILKSGEFTGFKYDLEAVRRALDLLLDLVEAFTQPFIQPSSASSEITSPNRRSFFDDTDPEVWQVYLGKVDDERHHVDEITQGRLPTLYTSFDKLRACTAFQLDECFSPHASPERSRSKTIHPGPPIDFDLYDPEEKDLPLPPSPISVSSEIGAWVANVVSQAIQTPDALSTYSKSTYSRLSLQETMSQKRAPSRETFYAESTTTTGTRPKSFAPSRSLKRTSERADSPQLVMKDPNTPKSRKKSAFYPIASTVFSSDERSIIHQQLTNDKIAVAKDTRRRQSRDQRAALDWILKNISTKTKPAEVEQILWEGANPNIPDPEFGFLFIRAAHSFSTSILNLLVEYGADITQTSHISHYSALHAAVSGNQLSNVQYLVDKGIFFDTPNHQGETPLHLAVKTPGGYAIAKWLLEAGADVDREAADGSTPFQMVLATSKADSKERSMMMELLLAQGADGELSAEGSLNRGKGLSVLGLI